MITVLPLIALAYSFLFLPIEVKANFAGFNIYSFRAAILLLAIPAVNRWVRDQPTFGLADILVLVSCLWTMLAFTYRDGFGNGFVRSAAIFIDTFGAYLIARTSIRSFNDVRVFLILLIPGLAFAGGFFALESVSGRLLVRPTFASLFGAAVNYEGGVAQGALHLLTERRLGLLRAYSTFSYPILGGTILASLLPVYLKSGLRGWPLVAGAMACALSFFSVSSAAIVGIAMGLGLIFFDKILPSMRPFNWYFVLGIAGAYGLVVNFLLESGVVGVIGRFTLNPSTAYIRRLQWDYGLQSIEKHPVFGIGFSEYVRADWMTSAIDAHFLFIGIRDGLITPLALLAAFVVIMATIGKRSRFLARHDRDLLIGINFMLAVLLFASMTVTYFSEANIWFMMALGLAASCAHAHRRVRMPAPPMRPQVRPSANAVPHPPGQAERPQP
ncbi:hypothetical protein MACH05_00620 [Qipengyuania nanhaisediminis]